MWESRSPDLDALLENVSPYTIPGQQANTDVVAEARKLIQMAMRKHEQALQLTESEPKTGEMSISLPAVWSDLLAGDYEKVIASLANHEDCLSPEFRDPLSWAFVMQGNALSDQAKLKKGEEADRLFALAGENYQAALRVKPDMHEALNNWGNALSDQAELKEGEEADRLFALAGENYQAALAIKPATYEALNNWGKALSDQAKFKKGEEADRLFALAGENYQAALQIKPDMHEALNNWGNALSDQAKFKKGEEAERLLALAGENYQAALVIKPDKHEALNNWGTTIVDQARLKKGEEQLS